MSELGSISGKLQKEEKLLRELNNALLVIEAHALKRSSDFGFSIKKVSECRKFVLDFATRLLSIIKEQAPPAELKIIVEHIKSGMKPIDDWIEDLETLINQIQNNKEIGSENLAILEDIMSLLDSQFTDDLQRLYSL